LNYKKKIRFTNEYNEIAKYLRDMKINTVCESANCPNRMECFSKHKLTFLIMGNICTRNCKFCNVKKGKFGEDILENEIANIKEVIKKLCLKYVVITSVTRDDIEDGGVGYYCKVIKELRQEFPEVHLEVLIPDFKKDMKKASEVAFASANVISHNIETIKRLYKYYRKNANFEFSLNLLKNLKELNPKIITKSGFMVGLGETDNEVFELLKILYSNKVDAVVIGQYFQPSKFNAKVERFVDDKTFKTYENFAYNLGFKYVLSERFARSSSLEIYD